jgi:Na+/proline symporter
LTEDLYKGFIRKNASQKELVWIGRAMVLAIAVFAITFAMNPASKVLGLVAYAWAGFGAAFGPLIILSLLWKRMTLNGAIIGMIVGAVTVIVWKNYLGHLGLYEIIPGFIFSAISIVVVSLLGKAPEADVVERFEKAEAQYQKEMSEI